MKKVEIYSTPTCHFCHAAKEFFAEHQVDFTNYDVATDMVKRKEMVDKSGQMGVPVIIVTDLTKADDKGEIIVGFDELRISELLGI